MSPASWCAARQEVANTLLGFVRPMIPMALASLLILAEPDFGTTAVMLATVMGLLFLGGVPLVNFIVLLGMVGAALAALVIFEPYRLQRLTSFTDPFADVFGKGYQLSQALIAFGRGEWLGVGLGHGIQKQHFLPEAHTDFLMATIGEEFGFAGVLVVISPFGVIAWRAFRIGARAHRQGDLFSAYVAHGLGLGLGLQAFINIGVNVGLLPTKGLTMPFMSYGSNSLIVAIMAVGVLLRIDRTLHQGPGRAHTSGGGSMGARVAVMAGGTGGHVFPALAVAERLRAEGLDVFWIGTRRGMEARLVPEHGFAMEWIGIEGLRGKGVAALATAPFRLAQALWQAGRILRRKRPRVVLGMGGFASGPGRAHGPAAGPAPGDPRAEPGPGHDQPMAGAGRHPGLRGLPRELRPGAPGRRLRQPGARPDRGGTRAGRAPGRAPGRPRPAAPAGAGRLPGRPGPEPDPGPGPGPAPRRATPAGPPPGRRAHPGRGPAPPMPRPGSPPR